MISVIIPAKSSTQLILHSVNRLCQFFDEFFPADYQIVVAVNGDEVPLIQQTANELRQEFKDNRAIVIHEHFSPQGKGAALRSAFVHAQGSVIAYVDSDLPYDLSFFVRGVNKINKGYELILGNRRLPESHFVIPVPLLSLAYGRHRLGLAFNWVVRRLFSSIETRDTQAGIKMMSRRLAEHAFAHQHCPGFFFDVELILSAQAIGARIAEQPVTLHLNYEKSTIRLVREGVRALRWLYRIKRNEYRGEYHGITPGDRPAWAESWDNTLVTADDWGLSPAVNDGILELVERGVVRRVSMMADAEHLTYKLPALLKLSGQCEFGLHFNLTYGAPPAEVQNSCSLLLDENLGYLSPGSLLLRLWNQRKNPLLLEAVGQEFQRQWQKVQSHGVELNYFDGHHHVHLFPGMIALLRPVLKSLRVGHTRLVLDNGLILSSKWPLWLFSWLAKTEVRRQGLNYLPCFYPSSREFQNTLALYSRLNFPVPTEVITHPAIQGDISTLKVHDSYNAGRVEEYQALLRIGQYLGGPPSNIKAIHDRSPT